jgi:hypothetical protein
MLEIRFDKTKDAWKQKNNSVREAMENSKKCKH